jgi:hypothetical protein
MRTMFSSAPAFDRDGSAGDGNSGAITGEDSG